MHTKGHSCQPKILEPLGVLAQEEAFWWGVPGGLTLPYLGWEPPKQMEGGNGALGPCAWKTVSVPPRGRIGTPTPPLSQESRAQLQPGIVAYREVLFLMPTRPLCE